jgi:hypothetical protein
MQSMSATNHEFVRVDRLNRLIARRFFPFTVLLFSCLFTGCQELVHMGQISDRESGFSIGDVLVEQQQSGGTWKQLGHSDGNGRWWILKDKMHGGGKIRLSKPGYHNMVIPESEFLQQSNIVLIPSDATELGDESGGSRRN